MSSPTIATGRRLSAEKKFKLCRLAGYVRDDSSYRKLVILKEKNV